MSRPIFIPLRLQSAFSMLEGAMHPSALVKACVAAQIPAAALTDRGVMFGALEFSDYCLNAGVQPIMAALLPIVRASVSETPGKVPNTKPTIDWLPLYAQDEAGYANLISLVSAAHVHAVTSEPSVTFDKVAAASQGLIALTGAGEGALARLLAQGQDKAAHIWLTQLREAFADRLYIEISRTGCPVETASEAALIALAQQTGLPLVATNPVLMPSRDFVEAHDLMLCIEAKRYVQEVDRPRSNPELAFKSPAEMAELFADLPEALVNSVVIAQRCGVTSPKRKPILPTYAKDQPEAELLAIRARAGLVERLRRSGVVDDGRYAQRLAYEVEIISRMGFPGYFLIVSDFIQWAKDNDIPVGPGRGSGAGSLVAWVLLITDLDPLRWGLLFERFLNPERVSMPDFDIDFCETRRGEVIRYVQQKYGADQVAQIITFGKMKARAVVKDVGRALQMSYGQVDGISKLIPNNPADPKTLAEALAEVPELAAKRVSERGADKLFDIALKLEGLYSHASTHAAGVVIGDRPLDQLVPMYRDPRSDMPVTQFDMKWVEQAGLVKFDFLGLKTLSVLQRAVEMLAQRGVTLELAALPWDSPEVFTLLSRGDTVGVFQLESDGMRRTLAQVKPDKFEDIIALVSLYRPGPMDNIPTYAARKHGHEKPDYFHPLLQPILEETYGVIIYQEQVMQIAQTLAGYSLGEADLLRRAMGKKKKEEMDQQRARFVEGAREKGVERGHAGVIFDVMEKFAGYGFNKSHAAAYALVAYHTAYLKACYPVEFFAASMAYDISNTDKLAIFAQDMRRSAIPLLPPDINTSQSDFAVEKQADGTLAVRYALGALKRVGEKAMADLVATRKVGGPFAGLDELAARIDPKGLNKRQIEALASSGAFDAFCANRAAVHASADTLLQAAANAASERTTGQSNLFDSWVVGEEEAAKAASAAVTLAEAKPWTLAQRMEMERDAFGFFFSGHPLDAYDQVLAKHHAQSFAALCANPPAALLSEPKVKTEAIMAGLIESASWLAPRHGRMERYLLVRMSDSSGPYMASCFEADTQALVEAAARAGDAVLAPVELLWREGEDTPRITLKAISNLDQLAGQVCADMEIRLSEAALSDTAQCSATCRAVQAVLNDTPPGAGFVRLALTLQPGRTAFIEASGRYRVDISLESRLRTLTGIETVTIAAPKG